MVFKSEHFDKCYLFSYGNRSRPMFILYKWINLKELNKRQKGRDRVRQLMIDK